MNIILFKFTYIISAIKNFLCTFFNLFIYINFSNIIDVDYITNTELVLWIIFLIIIMNVYFIILCLFICYKEFLNKNKPLL